MIPCHQIFSCFLRGLQWFLLLSLKLSAVGESSAVEGKCWPSRIVLAILFLWVFANLHFCGDIYIFLSLRFVVLFFFVYFGLFLSFVEFTFCGCGIRQDIFIGASSIFIGVASPGTFVQSMCVVFPPICGHISFSWVLS